MSNVQQIIKMNDVLSAIDPVYAKICRVDALQKICDLCKTSYENVLRQEPHHQSLPMMKAKLCAYLMCKGTNKVKARKAIDAFVALAHEDMQNVMNGGVTVVRLDRKGVTYNGDKDDENARVMGDSLKNTNDALEFFFEHM
jgi:hypothetical protein